MASVFTAAPRIIVLPRIHMLKYLVTSLCRYVHMLFRCQVFQLICVNRLVTPLTRVATHPEFVGTVSIFSPMSLVPTCFSRDSANVPTFKLIWNYLNFASKNNIRIIKYILPSQLNSILNNRPGSCHRCSVVYK